MKVKIYGVGTNLILGQRSESVLWWGKGDLECRAVAAQVEIGNITLGNDGK